MLENAACGLRIRLELFAWLHDRKVDESPSPVEAGLQTSDGAYCKARSPPSVGREANTYLPDWNQIDAIYRNIIPLPKGLAVWLCLDMQIRATTVK